VIAAILCLGLLALASGEQTDAEAAEWFVSKGKKQAEAGKHEEALGSLTNAIKLAPAHAEAHLMMGDSFAALGQKEDALKSYNIAAKVEEQEEAEEEEDFSEYDDDSDDAEEVAAPARKVVTKKKVKPGTNHEGADSLNIGFGNDDDDEEVVYESPPPPPEEEVPHVPNPHPEVWDDRQHSDIDNALIEKWFQEEQDPGKKKYTTAIPADQRAALLDLYHNTQGEGWIMNGNWGEGDPCNDRWWGCHCEESAAVKGQPLLTALSLHGNGMNGTIPESFGKLTHLTSLNLKSNHLGGDMPDSLSELTGLKTLRLGENRLGFKIGLVSTMEDLEQLDLAECHPKGSLADLTNLRKLEVIRLQGAFDGLKGEIPASLGDIKTLKKLNLAGGQLYGPIPDTLGHLEELKLNNNELTGTIPPSLLASKTIIKLDLSRNYMSGVLDIPEGGLSNCLILTLGFNNFVAAPGMMDRLFSIKGILAIDFTANYMLGGYISKNIGIQHRLEVLRMSSAGLEGPIPEEIAKTNLREVILHDNRLSGSLPASVALMQNLVTLKLNNNRMTGELPTEWKAPRLRRFGMHNNELTGTVPAALYDLPYLDEIYLDNNKIENFGQIPRRSFKFCSMDNNPGYDLAAIRPEGSKARIPEECMTHKLEKGGVRTFRICDTRVEIYVDVLKGQFGWEETAKDDWDASFGECYGGSHEYRHLRTNQKIMEFPDLDMIWDKGKYAANMERFRRTTYNGTSFEDWMESIPRSYILPSQQTEFDEYHTKHPDTWWLLKPRASCCGRGIKLINSVEELPRNAMGVGDGYIVQKFLHNPWLIGPGPTSRNEWVMSGKPTDGVVGPTGMSAGVGTGYKFVIRQFVVATSFEPVQMYTYPDGLLFWTRGPHSTASKDWKDRANFITDYFFTHVQTKLQLTTSEIRNLMQEQGVNEQLIWADIKQSVTKAFLPVAHRIAQQEGKFIPRRGGGFHVWGYDIMINEHGKAIVCEINAHPNTDLEIVKEDNEPDRTNLIKGDREMKMDLTEHMVRVIGMLADMPFDDEAKAKYGGIVDAKLPGLNWAKPGAACNSGMRCLKDYEYMDLVTAEFEDAAKGPLERNFPTSSQKHLEPMLMDGLPRTRLLLHYWSGPDGDGHLFNEDGTFKEKRPPYIAPKLKRRYARDEL